MAMQDLDTGNNISGWRNKSDLGEDPKATEMNAMGMRETGPNREEG